MQPDRFPATELEYATVARICVIRMYRDNCLASSRLIDMAETALRNKTPTMVRTKLSPPIY